MTTDPADIERERPFAITFSGDAIDIAGRVTDEESADRLIEAVTALKRLLGARMIEGLAKTRKVKVGS